MGRTTEESQRPFAVAQGDKGKAQNERGVRQNEGERA